MLLFFLFVGSSPLLGKTLLNQIISLHPALLLEKKQKTKTKFRNNSNPSFLLLEICISVSTFVSICLFMPIFYLHL